MPHYPIDHEDALCKSQITRPAQLAPSFFAFIEAFSDELNCGSLLGRTARLRIILNRLSLLLCSYRRLSCLESDL